MPLRGNPSAYALNVHSGTKLDRVYVYLPNFDIFGRMGRHRFPTTITQLQTTHLLTDSPGNTSNPGTTIRDRSLPRPFYPSFRIPAYNQGQITTVTAADCSWRFRHLAKLGVKTREKQRRRQSD